MTRSGLPSGSPIGSLAALLSGLVQRQGWAGMVTTYRLARQAVRWPLFGGGDGREGVIMRPAGTVVPGADDDRR